MMDPEWHPWLDNGYPPFGEVTAAEPRYTRGIGHHGSFDVTRTALATVSKPGGGTLLDSLWSATLTVLLEPFGAHESHNCRLWTKLGFGISYEQWEESAFDVAVLERLHRNLDEARHHLRDYPALLAHGC
jgi:hypothetical protein